VGTFESVKVFSLRTPACRVHEAVTRPETWLAGSGLLRELRLVRESGPDGLGARHRAVLGVSPGCAITWELETVRSVPGHLVEWRAHGDIEGLGLWELHEQQGVTRVANTWRVRPTQAWMGLISPLTRGLVAHQYDLVMQEGVRALATHLDVEAVLESAESAHGRAGRGAGALAGVARPVLRRHRQHA
jgi:hypothetical protein